MKGSIRFSLGLMMLLLALSCDAGPRGRSRHGSSCSGPSRVCRSPHSPSHHGPSIHGPSRQGPSRHGPSHHGPPHSGPSNHGPPDNGFGNCYETYCPEDGVRIRKEFISMTTAERERYITAVKTATTHPCFKTELETILANHRTLFPTDIHEKIFFLPWHRWFLLQYENILRRVDCGVTVPFWDWSSDNPFDTSCGGVWSSSNSGFGGTGTGESSCVQTGPFREDVWSLVPPAIDPNITNKNCLRREFMINETPNRADVQAVLDIQPDNFTDFEIGLRINLHDTIHYAVGGTMFTENSAASPEFFLHHAMVDLLWDDWQKKSNAHRCAFFPDVNETMTNTTLLPIELIDLCSQPGGVQVEYQRNTVNAPSGKGKPGMPRELNPKIIKMFNISPTEVEMANKMARKMSNTRRGLDPMKLKPLHASPAKVEEVNKME